MKACCEFGHSDFDASNDVIEKIRNKLLYLIEEENYDTFYLGNKGLFDYFIAKELYEIKKIYPHINRVLVLAYLNQKVTNNEKEYRDKMFDEILFPPLEKVPLRFAYSKRNQWIINNSDYIIFFVDYSWGKSMKMLEYANRKHKEYINYGKKTP